MTAITVIEVYGRSAITMASGMAAKINVKNMDYFKFKKIVVDGNRDDYSSCSREIRTLCDAVQTLAFRFEFYT